MPKPALKIILISFLLSSVLSPFSHAALLETIPLDSWVYDVVDELCCQGFFSSLHKNARPYTRGEIASLVLDLNLRVKNGTRLTDSQLWLLHKLNREFRDELEELYYRKHENTKDKTTIRYGISPKAHSTWAEGDSSYGRGQARFEVGLQFGRRFALKDRVVIDNKAEKERRYQGREWKNHLTGVLDCAYANIDLKYLQLLLGRDHLRWGPGPEDVLLLSDQIPPFDMVKIQGKAGSFKLFFFATVLDQTELAGYGLRAKRYLSGHRINLKLAWVEMGVSEVILYGGENRDLEPYYLNPILPYYGEQHNNYHDDNILWGFDISLFWFRNKEIYFEFLVDDFQYDFESEPHQTGFQIGLKWAQPFGWLKSFFNLEYTKINNWVYGQNKAQNRYTYHGYGMGSILGPDADRWSYRLIYHLTKDIDMSLGGQYRRKGEGRIDIPQDPAVSYPNKFPSGIVEKTNTHKLTFTYQPSVNLKLDLSFGFNNIENLGNESGKKEETFIFKAQLGLNLWKERRL